MVRELMKISRVGQRGSLPPSGAPGALSPLLFWIAAAAVGASVFAAYSPCLHFQFILDDARFLRDPRIQYPGHVWEYFANWVWAQFAGGPASFYRPLFLLWLRAGFIVSETSSWGWHLLSVLKHLSVAVLLGVLAWRLLQDRIAALIAGALFVLHPAHTEAVAWVTVPDPLMSGAVLGAILLYLRYRDYPYARERRFTAHGGGSRHLAKRGGERARKATQRPANTVSEDAKPSIAWLIASAILYLAALLAKETALVILLLLIAVALLSRADEGRGFASRLLAAFREMALFFAATLVYLLLRQHALGVWLSAPTQHLPWRTVLLSWPATLWFYVKVLVWPVRSYAFGDPAATNVFSVGGVLLPGLAVCAAAALLGVGLFWASSNAGDLPNPAAAGVRCSLLLGALLLVLPLLPALNLNGLNPEDSLHGRYAYLSATGLMLLIATGWRLARVIRMPLLVAAGCVAVVFFGLTVSQETAWKDDRAVFTEGHRNAPRNVFVARNLVRSRVQEALEWDRCQDAVPVFEDATRQYADDWVGWAALGNCLEQLNDLPRAERALRRAADLSHLPQVTERWREIREKCRAGCQPAADWQSAPH